MPDRLHLLPKHREVLEALLREHLPDVEVWAHGSRVNGRSHDRGALDLVLRGPGLTEIPSEQLVDFEDAMRESIIPFLVEARDWARLPERFHREIERDYVVLGNMPEPPPEKWPLRSIEEISEKVAMGPFGSSIKVSTFVSEGVPVISGQHLHQVRVDDTPGYNFISAEHAQKLSNANVQRGDIVFTHAGNIGQVAYIPETSAFKRYVISQRQFYMRCDQSNAVPGFIANYFKSPEGQHKLLANASQVGVPSIAQPVTYLRTIEVPLPPLSEQRAIAHILGTLDDKIELNRQMNETLEAMARAIFKDWFVDFGPTRAKAEGCAPYLAPKIWDLFPDALDGEGKPVGWTKLTVADIATQHKATVLPTAMPDTIFEHYSIPAYDRGEVPAFDFGLEIKSNKTELPKGAILLSKLNPEIPRVWLPNPKSAAPQICSTEFLVYIPKFGFDRSLLYAVFSASDFRQILQNMVTGTSKSHQRVLPNSVLEMMALCGESKVIQAFTDTVDCLFKQLLIYRFESLTLAQTRDLLLPKLVSGEIRIAEAKKVAEAVLVGGR